MRVDRRMKILRDRKGFTGLEAAIVLIAFVTVAAVFSYVMLGAGFFTAQKGKQSVDTGVKQASSSLELDGQYIYLKANKTGSNGDVKKIYFYTTLSAGGTPIDLEQTVLSIRYKNYYKQIPYNTMYTKNEGKINTGSKIHITKISINKTLLDNATDVSTRVGNVSAQVNITVDNFATVNLTISNADVYGMNNSGTFTGYILADVTGDINGTSITGKFYIALSGTVDSSNLNITSLSDGKLYSVKDSNNEEIGAIAYSLANDSCLVTLDGGTGNYTASNVEVNFSDGYFGYLLWWYTGVVYVDTPTYDNLLEKNEKYEISINTSAIKEAYNLAYLPQTNDYLTIELKPSIGSPLIINKQVPPSLSKLTWV